MAKRDDFEEDAGFLSKITKRDGMAPMPESMARMFKIIAAVAVVATIIVVAVATWPRKGGDVDENNLPVIHADTSETHIKPDEPGGMQVPNKDSTIFEAINKDDDQPQAVENLLEDREEPMKKDEVFNKDLDTEETGPEKVTAVAKGKEDTAQDAPQAADADKKVKVEPKKADIISTLKSEVGTDLKSSGSVYIQLASVKSEADANTKWAKLQSKHAQLKSLAPRFSRADLGAKGVFYRVQAGPLSLDVAKSTCAAIKANKGDCLIAK